MASKLCFFLSPCTASTEITLYLPQFPDVDEREHHGHTADESKASAREREKREKRTLGVGISRLYMMELMNWLDPVDLGVNRKSDVQS